MNENFDMILVSSANLINYKCKDWLLGISRGISKLKIPIYFIGIGLQTHISDTKYKFVNTFKRECCEFIESVYSTKGTFSLRGHKTSEVFEKLGYQNYTITGCPSIFILGKNFQIHPKKIEASSLLPLINGTDCLKNNKINKYLHINKHCTFIDQDRFYRILKEKDKHPFRYNDFSIKMRFGKTTLKLLKENRIRLFEDVPVWMDFIKEGGFNFSFGSRIHGNIIAILCQVPALIYARDMRVLEMAQFYEIPYVTTLDKNVDLMELYESLDYTKFNKNYALKFDNFQKFFNNYKIPCKMGSNLSKILN